MIQTGTATSGTAASTKRKPPCITSRLARTVFMAAAKDYQRPEVQDDYRRWQMERAASMAAGAAKKT